MCLSGQLPASPPLTALLPASVSVASSCFSCCTCASSAATPAPPPPPPATAAPLPLLLRPNCTGPGGRSLHSAWAASQAGHVCCALGDQRRCHKRGFEAQQNELYPHGSHTPIAGEIEIKCRHSLRSANVWCCRDTVGGLMVCGTSPDGGWICHRAKRSCVLGKMAAQHTLQKWKVTRCIFLWLGTASVLMRTHIKRTVVNPT